MPHITVKELSPITVTGMLSYFPPIDGPTYAITPEDNLTVPMDDGRIYLYGDALSPNLDGKQVKITGKIVENYLEYQMANNYGALGGDPSTSSIFVTDVEVLS